MLSALLLPPLPFCDERSGEEKYVPCLEWDEEFLPRPHSIWLFGSDGAAVGSPGASSRSRTSGTRDSRDCLSSAGRACIGAGAGADGGTGANGGVGGGDIGGTRSESAGGAVCGVSEKLRCGATLRDM